MKINWKILIPSIVILVVFLWMVDSIRARSYSGTRLNFGVGNGPITVTNTSNNPVPIRLVGTGTLSFSVSSKTDGLSGQSVRQNDNGSITQAFEFQAPPGVSELIIARGSNLNFIADTDARLAVTVQPLGAGESTTTILGALLVIVAALFYLSRTTDHRWLNRFRRKENATQTAERLEERQAFKRRFDRTSAEKP